MILILILILRVVSKRQIQAATTAVALLTLAALHCLSARLHCRFRASQLVPMSLSTLKQKVKVTVTLRQQDVPRMTRSSAS